MPLICLASPKGGVGKTTLAANIAGNIALAGHRVVALDLDPENTLRLHFGVSLTDVAGFTGRLSERPDWRALLRPTTAGVNLLAYGSSDMAGALHLTVEVTQTPGLLNQPVREMLADRGVWIIADTPPGPSPMLAALLPLADLLVTVLLVDATSTSLIPAIESGQTYDMTLAGQCASAFVLNQLDTRTRLGPAISAAATRHLGDRLLGVIYRDEHVSEAVAAQKLMSDYAPVARATQDMATVSQAIMQRFGRPPPPAPVPTETRRRGWFWR